MVSGHPDVSEYPERYGRYVDLVPEDDICRALVSQLEDSVADFGRYSLGEWLDEFVLVRKSNVALARHLPADGWTRMGTVSLGPISVRAMAYLMVGHERHHLRIIQEKYLNGLNPDATTQ